MNIILKTLVKNNHHKSVMSGFDKALFNKLAPPFPPFRLNRFDGCKEGDIVELTLNFLLFKQQWNSKIISHGETESSSFFVDEGTKLPFFLSTWKHTHLIEQQGKDVAIIDDIKFTIKPKVIIPFVFPGLYLVFLYRKPIYKRFFSQQS